MSIAVDSTTNGSSASASSLTWSHTCTGGKLALFVGVYGDTAADHITGVTYNAVSMTQIDVSQVPGDRYIYLYYLLAPATGAHNVVVSANATIIIGGVSVSYTGVTQSGIPDGHDKNTASSVTTITKSITTTGTDWIIAVGKSSTGTVSAGSGTTLRIGDSGGFGLFDSNSDKAAGSNSLTINNGVSANMAMILGGFIDAIPPMTAAVGTFTLTGYAATLHKVVTLVASVGTFILTGFTALFKDRPNPWTNQSKNTTTWTDIDKS